MLAFVQDLGHQIYAIDTGFQRPAFDAAYLLVDSGRAAFFDVGTAHAVPRLLATLESLGLAPDAVDWVIPSHVHLDHAGGVGQLMQALPSARLLVHPRGLRHMVDPRALWMGASAVYSPEQMQRDYDQLLPVPPERAEASHDGQQIRLGERLLTLIDTPGHARHHHALWDERSRCWFTGDTFGLSYREFDTARGPWMLPTSTPVQFDPEALKATVTRMLSFAPEGMLLTHFGRVGQGRGDVSALAEAMLDLCQAMVDAARQVQARELDAAARHEALCLALRTLYLSRVREHGCALDDAQVLSLLATDIELNAQGLAVWLDRKD